MVALVELQDRWNTKGAPGPWHLAVPVLQWFALG